jgi:hypothetical protein
MSAVGRFCCRSRLQGRHVAGLVLDPNKEIKVAFIGGLIVGVPIAH